MAIVLDQNGNPVEAGNVAGELISLRSENAKLKAELEQWQRSVCDQGEVIENLKAELAAAQRVEPVDLNPDTFMRLIKTIKYLVGIAERGEGKKIADDETPEQFVLGYVKKLEQSEFRAGMLAAAEICEQVVEYPPGYNGQWEGYGPVRITRTGNDCAAAIREAAKK